MSPPLQKLYDIFGRAVFLVIPLGTKRPVTPGWQRLTFEDTQGPEYQAMLLEAIKRGGNIGVLHGPASDNLHSIDIDDDELAEMFAAENPELAKTVRTQGKRGCNFWLRPLPGTTYPNAQAIYRLKTAEGNDYGELRVGGGDKGAQTIVYGLHPDGGHYQIVIEGEPARINFANIKWFGSCPGTEPPPRKAEHTGTPTDLDKRIESYMAKVLPSIAGEHGDDQLLRAALLLVCGWDLSQTEALPYLRAFNARCKPPWSEHRLLYKLSEADEHGQGVRGRLRDAKQEPRTEARPRDAGEDGQQQTGTTTQEERTTGFSESITKGSKLVDIELPPRKMIINDWFKEGDLGFIFAYRGAGKTWLTIDLCTALSDGGKCGPWQVNGEWPTLYIDGEMSHDDDKSRILGLRNPIPENLYVLNHEVLFHYHKLVMNFGNPGDQAIITQICLDKGIKVLVLDNLGCLVSGVEENKADEWEKMLPWLLDLRRLGISVIIVHHSGHDSSRMRGTVKREDSAAWVLRLDDQREDYSEAGAHFITRFRKLRGEKPALDYEWWYAPSGDGGVLVTFKEANRASIVLQWVRDGLSSATAIAKEMGVSEGAVSKLATKLIKEGILTKNGREYVET